MKNLILSSLMILTMACAQSPDKKSQDAGNKKPTAPHTFQTLKKCRQSQDERVLEIKGNFQSCELLYTKFGSTVPVASSTKGHQHCQEVSDRILNNLTRAGYTCE